MINSLNALTAKKNILLKEKYENKLIVSVGLSSCGKANGADEIYNEIKTLIDKKIIDVLLDKTACIGFCSKEPIVNIIFPGKFIIVLQNMNPTKINEILNDFKPKNLSTKDIMCVMEDIEKDNNHNSLYETFKSYIEENKIPHLKDIPFYKKQLRLLTKKCGIINPLKIEDYIIAGGYFSFSNVLETYSPFSVIEEVKKSELRGKSGSGFKTGDKWELCSKSDETQKYIVCNADEGDPGSYVNRHLLEGDPHSIIEGMLICGYAVKSNHGYIYIRKEYKNSINIMKKAITDAKNYGFLGKNIFGKDFSFDIEVREGGYAFICGEETSLLSSIEGESIEPRQKPPFPGVKGLFGKPTVVNNVETLASIPYLFNLKEKDIFLNSGTNLSKGTKLFSISGDIVNKGVIEVPYGITLKEIIHETGGGITDNKKLKAIQPGGHFGGFIPESLIDLKIDYEEFQKNDFNLGSGGIIILDETKSIIDTVKFFLSFAIEESCGKCTPCRDGTIVLLEIIERILDKKGNLIDLEILNELSNAIKEASFCGLGQSAPIPVLSSLRYFKDEYLSLIKP